MLEFINHSDWRRHIRLDIVGFLAILGEASIQINAQATFLSPASFLPRLVPAPQALINPRRPTRLQPEDAVVVGRKSGNLSPTLSPFTHILHGGENLSPFQVKWIWIKSKGENSPVEVQVNLWGPLTWLAVFGCSLFVVLLVLSIHFGDGWALLATLLLGFLTTLIQCGSWNTLILPKFELKRKRRLPDGDVIVKYPNGSFVVVKCEEKIARKLYFGVERCKYAASDGIYRAIALSSTLILMFAVIFLGNAKTNMQLAFAASYIVLNAAYWLVAAIPPRFHWNTNAFDIKTLASEQCDNYTAALWTTIAITGDTHWVAISGVAPQNDPWKNWVKEAQTTLTGWTPEHKNGKPQKPSWNCQDALTRILQQAEDEELNDSEEPNDSEASEKRRGVERMSTDEVRQKQIDESGALETMVNETSDYMASFSRTDSFPAGGMV